MTTVWLECPTHGFIQNPDLIDIKPGSDATFIGSIGLCPTDGHQVPIVDAKYTVSDSGVMTIEAPDGADGDQLRRLREQHPDA